MRTRTSSSRLCPSARALAPAMSSEIARSPANLSETASTAGNEMTSVGLSFPRKQRLSCRISRLEVSKTLMSPRNPTAFLATDRKRRSLGSLILADCFAMVNTCAKQKTGECKPDRPKSLSHILPLRLNLGSFFRRQVRNRIRREHRLLPRSIAHRIAIH